MNDGFIPIHNIVALTDDYLTKRMSVKLVTGEIVTGVVQWQDESDFEEETGVEGDWGFVLEPASINGKPLKYGITIPESRIVAYQPLEPANTPEELEKLLGVPAA